MRNDHEARTQSNRESVRKNEGVEKQHAANTTRKETSRKEHPYFKNEKKRKRGPQTDYAHGRTHPAAAEATTGIQFGRISVASYGRVIAKVWQLDARTLWECDATVASEQTAEFVFRAPLSGLKCVHSSSQDSTGLKRAKT